MIVLFYEGVKGKAGGEQPHVCNSGRCCRLSETLYQHQVCSVPIRLEPYYVSIVWGDGLQSTCLLRASHSAYLAGCRIE